MTELSYVATDILSPRHRGFHGDRVRLPRRGAGESCSPL